MSKVITIGMIALLMVCAVLVLAKDPQEDIKIGTYEVKPAFKQTLDYNPFADMRAISQEAKGIVAACKGASDKRACVGGKIAAAQSDRLSWHLDACPSQDEVERFYEDLVGLMRSCGQAAGTCSCGDIRMPDLANYKIQVEQRGSDILLRLFIGDTEVSGMRRAVPGTLQEYSGALKTIKGFKLDQGSCEDKGYCAVNPQKSEFKVKLVHTDGGVAFQKSQEVLPVCAGLSPKNMFAFCVETKRQFPRFDPFSRAVNEQPLRYRFALQVGSPVVISELKEGIGDPQVIALIEERLKDYSFADEQEAAIFRSYVLAGTYAENQLWHTNAQGEVAVNDNGASQDHGAMQINNVAHPGCFSDDDSRGCHDLAQCDGKPQPRADDLECNVAYGVSLRYGYYQLAKQRSADSYYTQMCGGLDVNEMAMKFYNAGAYADDGPGCEYVSRIRSHLTQIFK